MFGELELVPHAEESAATPALNAIQTSVERVLITIDLLSKVANLERPPISIRENSSPSTVGEPEHSTVGDHVLGLATRNISVNAHQLMLGERLSVE